MSELADLTGLDWSDRLASLLNVLENVAPGRPSSKAFVEYTLATSEMGLSR
jgi:hypothetical protein